jgi:hypothetical protein
MKKSLIVIFISILILSPVAVLCTSCSSNNSETTRKKLMDYSTELSRINAEAVPKPTVDQSISNSQNVREKLIALKSQLNAEVKQIKDKKLLDAADRLLENTDLWISSLELVIAGQKKDRFNGVVPPDVKVVNRDYPFEFIINGHEVTSDTVLDAMFKQIVINKKRITEDWQTSP